MLDLTHNPYYFLPNSQLFPFVSQGTCVDDENSVVKNYVIKAYSLVKEGHFEQARDLYGSAIIAYPEQPFFYACRSILNRRLEDEEGSFYDYQVAKKFDFNYHHFLEWKENEDMMEESEELLELDQRLKVEPTNSQLYINRAMLHVQHYCYQEAIADFSQALALYNAPSYLVSRAAVYMRMLQYNLALDDLDLAISLDNNLLDAYLYRAKLYMAIREMESAKIDFDHCIAMDGQNINFYEERAQFFEVIGRLEAALEDYSTLILLDSSDFYPYVLRADLYEKSGQRELAIHDYDKAISLNPYYSDLYQYRGKLKEELGDHSGAESDYLKFEELEDE